MTGKKDNTTLFLSVNENQTLPKTNPKNAAISPPNKEQNDNDKNCIQCLSINAFSKSDMKVENVLKLPKKPTQINIYKGEELLRK